MSLLLDAMRISVVMVVPGISAAVLPIVLSGVLFFTPGFMGASVAEGFGEFSVPPPKPVSKPISKPAKIPARPSSPKNADAVRKKRQAKTRSPKAVTKPKPTRPRTPARKFETLSWISGRRICSGSAQVCSQTATWPLVTEVNDDYFLTIRVPVKYCSPFQLDIALDGRSMLRTQILRPGDLGFYRLGRVNPGSHQLQLSAIGAEGGCNQGVLRDWGVDLELSNRDNQTRAGANSNYGGP